MLLSEAISTTSTRSIDDKKRITLEFIDWALSVLGDESEYFKLGSNKKDSKTYYLSSGQKTTLTKMHSEVKKYKTHEEFGLLLDKPLKVQTSDFLQASEVQLKKFHTAPQYNMGDIGEGIMAAAIAARFVSKTKIISNSDVHNIIQRLARVAGSTTKATLELKSPNANPKIKDIINVTINIPTGSSKALLDASNYEDFSSVFDAAVSFVNQGNVMTWADFLYNNNFIDTIEINNDGITNNKETKTDIEVKINDTWVPINLSIKTGQVGQFGQVYGFNWPALTKLFLNLFNVKIDSFEDKYYKKLEKGHNLETVVDTVAFLYTEVAKELNKLMRMKATSDKVIENLAKGIKYYATLNDTTLELINISKGKVMSYNFEKSWDMLKLYNLSAKTVVDGDGKPRIVITGLDKKRETIFLTVRLKVGKKKDNFAITHVIEKGSLMEKLLANRI